MATWDMTNARAKFCEVVRLAESQGEQILTRNGEQVAVVVSLEEWEALKPLSGNQ